MSFESRTIGTYLSAVASEEVTPAGGTSAAVVGAIGASLCEMACLHTVGREGYEDVEPELEAMGDELATLRRELLRLADSDATAVEELLESTDDERHRNVKRATTVPLTIAEACLAVLESANRVTAMSSENVRSDAVSGAFLVRGALQAAVYTVRTNTRHIEDSSVITKMEQRTSEIETMAADVFDQIDSNLAL